MDLRGNIYDDMLPYLQCYTALSQHNTHLCNHSNLSSILLLNYRTEGIPCFLATNDQNELQTRCELNGIPCKVFQNYQFDQNQIVQFEHSYNRFRKTMKVADIHGITLAEKAFSSDK